MLTLCHSVRTNQFSKNHLRYDKIYTLYLTYYYTHYTVSVLHPKVLELYQIKKIETQ